MDGTSAYIICRDDQIAQIEALGAAVDRVSLVQNLVTGKLVVREGVKSLVALLTTPSFEGGRPRIFLQDGTSISAQTITEAALRALSPGEADQDIAEAMKRLRAGFIGNHNTHGSISFGDATW